MASGTHKEEEYFPVKLYRMVEDEAFNEIIWWNKVCRIRNLNLLSLKFFSAIVDLDDAASLQ